jgi:hypothetical protein
VNQALVASENRSSVDTSPSVPARYDSSPGLLSSESDGAHPGIRARRSQEFVVDRFVVTSGPAPDSGRLPAMRHSLFEPGHDEFRGMVRAWAR